MNKESIFIKNDYLAGALGALISLAVYIFTTAPNVTLLDSGEFIVAAQHLGVPHPTGYPLWTILGWLFQLLPLGNAAWEIALFSAIFAGLAVGLTVMLLQSTLRWIFADSPLFHHRVLPYCVSLGSALLMAFSQSMWSQAVIAEVYALHAFLVVLFLICQYAWIRNPSSFGLLLLSFFLLALTFSNHQLALALAPLPFIGVALLRREWFWDLVIASLVTVLLVYLGFAILSGELPVLRTAIRFLYFVVGALGVRLVVRRFQIEWRLVAYLPFVILLGLAPYAYMPLASSTNPPMNWGYTRSTEGFYYSFNRSQYGGSLSDQSLRTLGRLMGVENPHAEKSETNILGRKKLDILSEGQQWCGFFWLKLMESFTPFAFIAFLIAILVILRAELRQRVWVYFLILAFVLAAFLQPIVDGAGIDNAAWWLQMPYHTYTNLIFSLIIGIGFAWIANWLASKRARLVWSAAAIPLLALWPLFHNAASCSQRDHWFGWDFGYDMLKDLPKNAVVFGGTDPGRFVPTYMILGESTQPAHVKRDPNFDRRDLYIITQNGLSDSFYLRYIRDHYSSDRPAVTSKFERWLGRDKAYPKEPLILPTPEEQMGILKNLAENPDAEMNLTESPQMAGLAAVARWIFDHNKDKHEFFVEESFPMKWSYDYAVPHGLSYRINPEPLKEIPPEAVKQDFVFWNGYAHKLLSNPRFYEDYDARRSFSKLRTTTAHLYRHRKLNLEAELAYRQSLQLWPGNLESLLTLSRMLWSQERYEDSCDLIYVSLLEDPNNTTLYGLYATALEQKEIQDEIRKIEPHLTGSDEDAAPFLKLIRLQAELSERELAQANMEKATNRFATNAEVIRTGAILFSQLDKKDQAVVCTKRLVELTPKDYSAWLLSAQILAHFGLEEDARAALQKGLAVGGAQAKVEAESIPETQKLLASPAPAGRTNATND